MTKIDLRSADLVTPESCPVLPISDRLSRASPLTHGSARRRSWRSPQISRVPSYSIRGGADSRPIPRGESIGRRIAAKRFAVCRKTSPPGDLEMGRIGPPFSHGIHSGDPIRKRAAPPINQSARHGSAPVVIDETGGKKDVVMSRQTDEIEVNSSPAREPEWPSIKPPAHRPA